MKIAVIGAGYVGLTTGTCFAEMGHEVICVDIDEAKIKNLQKGIIPIYEPGLEELIKRNVKEKRLEFSTNTANAVELSEVVFSAVGTPADKDHRADLMQVKEVATTFGKHLNGYKVFVNKSTVPVGTGNICRKIIEAELQKRNVEFEFDAVSNPEFLREGNAISDTINPDRVVVGYETGRGKEMMLKLYKAFTERSDKNIEILCTDLKTAEVIKYASNSMLATKISFINEMANFCEKCGADIRQVAKGIGLDKRIGKEFLNAGIGYGGSCFPKDVQALIQTGKEFDFDFQILKAVESVNKKQKEVLFHKLKKHLCPLKGKIIAVWGLAFKPKTDDMREASSIKIIEKLQKDGALVQVFDPASMETAKKHLKSKKITYSSSAYIALQDADALLILTEWDEFRSVDLANIKTVMKGNLILDGRNIFEKADAENIGFTYEGIG